MRSGWLVGRGEGDIEIEKGSPRYFTNQKERYEPHTEVDSYIYIYGRTNERTLSSGGSSLI